MTEHPHDLTDPATFSHWVTDTVRFSDTDMAGHVNNVAVATYVETGRLAFVHEVTADREPGDGFILGHLSVSYRKESHYPGEVRVGSRVARVGNKSFTVGAGVFKDGACIATAESVVVYRIGTGAAPIPEHLRRPLEALAAASHYSG